jgi:hypothetical protein
MHVKIVDINFYRLQCVLHIFFLIEVFYKAFVDLSFMQSEITLERQLMLSHFNSIYVSYRQYSLIL